MLLIKLSIIHGELYGLNCPCSIHDICGMI